MQYLIIPVIAIGAWLLWPSEEWMGFFYPNRYDLTEHVETGIFDSLEECRDHTLAYGEDRGIPYTRFDYECGLNCEGEYGAYVCEETLQ